MRRRQGCSEAQCDCSGVLQDSLYDVFLFNFVFSHFSYSSSLRTGVCVNMATSVLFR